MEQISKVRRCYSCGVELQCTDPTKDGYVDKNILENPDQKFIFCNKCFELEHFRSTSNEPMIDDDFKTVLSEAKKRGDLLVYVVNLFSFETSFSKEVVELIKDMKIMVVGMKYDLLPVGTDRDKIAEYVAHRFRVAGIKIQASDVSIVTKQEDENIREVLTKIFELKEGKNVFVIGCTEAGKTALIQGFLRNYSNFSNGNIIHHPYKNTNLRVMEIPLTNKSSMYETPGITITNSLMFGLDAKTTKKMHVSKAVEPREINLYEGNCLLIGGLAIVQLVKGPKTSITCYFNEDIQLKKRPSKNIEEKFIKLNKTNKLVPSLSRVRSITDMETFDIDMMDKGITYRDIGFAGIGWMNLQSKKQKIRIYLPKGVSLYTSRPKIEV